MLAISVVYGAWLVSAVTWTIAAVWYLFELADGGPSNVGRPRAVLLASSAVIVVASAAYIGLSTM